MTLWVKLDYKKFYPRDGLKAKDFTDIASVKKWFREKKEKDYSVVKHDGKLMKHTALVPKTTKDNCLHLLREIRKALCHDILMHYYTNFRYFYVRH